jgi:poly-gamma-glutamate synthesis protein (capsule biosynthesis protein)
MRPALLTALALAAISAGACSDDDTQTATPAPSVVRTVTPIPAAITAVPSATVTPTPVVDSVGEFTLIAGGDVMLGRTIGEGIAREGNGYPFAFVADLLRAANIAFVNLELPLTERGDPAQKNFVFRAPPSYAGSLAEAGIDVVSTANNHAVDYGVVGLQDTWAALASAGVAHSGSGENVTGARAPLALEVNDLRIALLAYTNTPVEGTGWNLANYQATADAPGVAWLDPASVAQDVAAAKEEADVVIVSMHTGYEYTDPPTQLQIAAAHAAIDAGADLVLGHHPHVLQGIETYNGGLVIYSLGNFVFDFDYLDYAYAGLPSQYSALLNVTLNRDGVVECSIVPVLIAEADGRPRPAEGADAEPVLQRLRSLSDGSCGLAG